MAMEKLNTAAREAQAKVNSMEVQANAETLTRTTPGFASAPDCSP